MFDDEIARLAERLGLGAQATEDVRALVRRAASAPPSSTPTLILSEDEPMWTPPPQSTTAVALEPHMVAEGRFEDLGRIATGGMGDVRRVRDLELKREFAMKVLRADRQDDRKLLLRFVEEAQTTAQLQHPHIVPVHELGRLQDGRLFFTMQEVRGRTLKDLLREVHDVSDGHPTWQPTAQRVTFRRLVEVFRQVCLAVAYAHSRGVVHRDLKPDNVMVGAFGEVRVMDWGLAKVLHPDDADAIQVVRRDDTREGRVSGTPNYMSPEQAFGSAASAASDVYSLGATLFEILAGRPPYVANDVRQVLRMVRSGAPAQVPGPVADQLAFAETRAFHRSETQVMDTPTAYGRPPVPSALVAVCEHAMARDPSERFDDALQLAERVEAWLVGAEQSALARSIVGRAHQLLPEAERLRAEATALRERAAAHLADVPTWASEDDKEPAWVLEDRAEALESEAHLVEVDADGLLRGALAYSPGLVDAHVALAQRHQQHHREAEAHGDRRAAARAEVQLRAHAAQLPEDHEDREELMRYLKGSGRLVLRTDPPGAQVELQRYVAHVRRLVPIHVEHLGATPFERRLAMGSYLLLLRAEGRAPVRLPLHLPRQGVWDATPPGGDRGHAIVLPEPDALGDDDCYVPAGWARLGGVKPTPAMRVWFDGYVIRRHPVTNAEYLAYLDDLVARGHDDEAARREPRERGEGVGGHPIYGRRDDGTYTLVPDADGDLVELDWPVMYVSWHDAMAYAAWLAERTGLPWRLPTEWEREKAGRGADGRRFPWGDTAEPSWCRNRYAMEGRPLVGSVHAFTDDESPYGVRGLSGNVLDWCLNDFEAALPPDQGRHGVGVAGTGSTRVLRGGAWTLPIRLAQCGQRQSSQPHARFSHVGFRVARSLPG